MQFTLVDLWNVLGNIPTDDNGNIELQFLHFRVGTDRLVIWHWFEETFDISIVKEFGI